MTLNTIWLPTVRKQALYEKKVASLEEESTTLNEALQQQQRFMESVDTEQRKHNLIITGMSESEPLHTEDGIPIEEEEDKVQYVLSLIGHSDTSVKTTQRLGRQHVNAAQNRPRPIKLVLEHSEDRGDILKSTKKLNQLGDAFSKIYIKKDLHPGVHRKLRRLRETERSERANPDNTGRRVAYDWKRRNVTVDDFIVDTYRPKYF